MAVSLQIPAAEPLTARTAAEGRKYAFAEIGSSRSGTLSPYGDSPEALPLLQHLNPGSVSADKAYDSDSIISYLSASNIQAVIPPRSNRLVQRVFDKHLYKNRNLVERFFCRIKQFRRIATRYDKLAQRFASFVALAAAFIWLV